MEHVEEEKKIVDALQQNGYPSSFVHLYSCPSRRKERDDQRPRTTLTLPYINGVSEAVRWILAPLDIQVVFRPLSTLWHMLVHPKNLVPMEEQKSVVYCVPCNGCPKKYIGQTGCSLKHWLAEHGCVLKKGGCSHFCPCRAHTGNRPSCGPDQGRGD